MVQTLSCSATATGNLWKWECFPKIFFQADLWSWQSSKWLYQKNGILYYNMIYIYSIPFHSEKNIFFPRVQEGICNYCSVDDIDIEFHQKFPEFSFLRSTLAVPSAADPSWCPFVVSQTSLHPSTSWVSTQRTIPLEFWPTEIHSEEKSLLFHTSLLQI